MAKDKGLTQTGDEDPGITAPAEDAAEPIDLQQELDTKKGHKNSFSLEEALTALLFADESKIGGANIRKLRKQLEAQGIQFDENNNPILPEGFEQNFDAATLQKLRPLLKNRNTNKAVLIERENEFLAAQNQQQNQEYFDENIAPTFEKIRMQIDDMLSNPSFSAAEQAMLRSNIAAMAKGSEESRLRRVSAVLGDRNMDPSTPAGAALANRAAEEADRAFMDAMRQNDIYMADVERQSAMQELGLSEQLIAHQAETKRALESGDLSLLMTSSSNLAGLLQAIQIQRETLRAEKDAARTAFQTGLITEGVRGSFNVAAAAASSFGTGGMAG